MYFSNRHGPLTIIPQIIFPSTILFSIIGLPYLRTRCHPIEANSKMAVYFIFHPQLNTHIFNDFNNAIIKMKYHGLRGSSNDFFIAFGQTKVKNHEKEHCRNNIAQLLLRSYLVFVFPEDRSFLLFPMIIKDNRATKSKQHCVWFFQ